MKSLLALVVFLGLTSAALPHTNSMLVEGNQQQNIHIPEKFSTCDVAYFGYGAWLVRARDFYGFKIPDDIFSFLDEKVKKCSVSERIFSYMVKDFSAQFDEEVLRIGYSNMRKSLEEVLIPMIRSRNGVDINVKTEQEIFNIMQGEK